MKNLVVLTGAGISADSGISTFRDSDGLWENYKIEDVCTVEALLYNRNTLIDFYNSRRRDLLTKKPNPAHLYIKKLEEYFNVEVITQNIDDLHERAASKNILHLHGELSCLRNSMDFNKIYKIKDWNKAVDEIYKGASLQDFEYVWKQAYDAKDTDGSLLRPHVVFFGEDVPAYGTALEIVRNADILLVVGTSLAVYPAAALAFQARKASDIYVLDPADVNINGVLNAANVHHIKERAAVGMPKLYEELVKLA